MDYSAIRPFLARPRNSSEQPMSRLRPQDAETRAQRAAGADFSEALARGLGVISAFDEQRRQMTLSDVARAVDLPRATVRRALATLVALGLPGGRWPAVPADAAHPEACDRLPLVRSRAEHPAAGLRAPVPPGRRLLFGGGAGRRGGGDDRSRRAGAAGVGRPRRRLSPAGVLQRPRPRVGQRHARCRARRLPHAVEAGPLHAPDRGFKARDPPPDPRCPQEGLCARRPGGRDRHPLDRRAAGSLRRQAVPLLRPWPRSISACSPSRYRPRP